MNNVQPAVVVKDLHKTFKLPLENHSGIKQVIVNAAKRKKGYEIQHVLKGVSFEIKKGEFFGIVGRNGSGKSTLLKLLAGIYVPDSGLVQVNGSLTPFIELGVGFNPELTGYENVFLNGALLGFSRKEMEEMYNDIVEFAELEKFMDQKLKNYSSGMQVRLAFSIAIRAQSDILLLDEVLAVGDANFQQKCYSYFEELKQKGQTIIFVSHDMSAVTRFCTNAIYLKDGELLAQGSPIDIADIYAKENIANHEQISEENNKIDEINDDEVSLSKTHAIHSKVISEDDKYIVIDFKYSTKDKSNTDDIYIGISVASNGISIAEITTSLVEPISGSGAVSYRLDKTLFNGGAYTIGAGLFSKKNRSLLAVTNNRESFTVLKNDKTRGAFIKLDDNWNY